MTGDGNFDGALKAYREALELVPPPLSDWEAATWILVAIGDVLFQQGHYEEARDALTKAMQCPDAIGNPFVHLRLGQSCFELEDIVRAHDELTRAYMGGGAEIFAHEDPKYWESIKGVLRPRLDS